MTTQMHIRPMRASDLDTVLEIEQLSFVSPWSWDSFKQELVKSYGLCYIAEKDEQVVGYAIAWRIEDELHIANVAVHPDYRRRGIGQSLINFLLEGNKSVPWTGLEVRRGNTAARALYKKLGFQEVGIRRNYYEAEGEDAVLMVQEPGESEAALE